MKKIEYYFKRNRVKASVVKDRYFRLVSDEPLTKAQIHIIQEKLGYPPFPFAPVCLNGWQKQKLGKNALQWYCFDV